MSQGKGFVPAEASRGARLGSLGALGSPRSTTRHAGHGGAGKSGGDRRGGEPERPARPTEPTWGQGTGVEGRDWEENQGRGGSRARVCVSQARAPHRDPRAG